MVSRSMGPSSSSLSLPSAASILTSANNGAVSSWETGCASEKYTEAKRKRRNCLGVDVCVNSNFTEGAKLHLSAVRARSWSEVKVTLVQEGIQGARCSTKVSE